MSEEEDGAMGGAAPLSSPDTRSAGNTERDQRQAAQARASSSRESPPAGRQAQGAIPSTSRELQSTGSSPRGQQRTRNATRATKARSCHITGLSYSPRQSSTRQSPPMEAMTDDPHSTYIFEDKTLHRDSFRCLYEFFESNTLCDVEIVCGDKSINCHRLVLACTSRYFKTMFTSKMSECHQRKVTIQDIEESALEQLIKFAYTAKITLTIDNVQGLLYASSILQVENVAHACCDFMKTHLHPTNCIGIRSFAEQHGRLELITKADQFTRDHFLGVVASEEYVSMTEKHLAALISSHDLNVNSEVEVYDAVMKWIKHDAINRKVHLPTLLSHVKLALLPPTFLLESVSNEDLIKSDFKCRDCLDKAKDYQLSLANVVPDFKLCDKVLPRKSCAGVLFCVGGRGASGDPFRTIECYDVRRDRWFQVADMSTRRRHVGVVAVGGKLYAIGGHDGTEHLNTGEAFEPTTNKWRPIAPMVTLRRGIALACLGGPIYAVGGLDDTSCFNIVERYDPDSDTWSSVQAMNYPRGGVAVATLKGHLYAIGGNDGATSLDSCERYDPHLNRWTIMTAMNTRRAGAGVAELSGHLYVVGGFDDNSPLDSVERYDPVTNKWTVMASMSCPRGGVGVATLGGKIYAVGGHDGSNYLNSVETYDALNDKWQLVSSISTCRAGAGIAVINCHISSLKDITKVNISAAGRRNKPGGSPRVCCTVRCSIVAQTSVIYRENKQRPRSASCSTTDSL